MRPDPQMFNGASYSSIPHGYIKIIYRGDTANITFSHNNKETEVTLKTYRLSALRKERFFKSAPDQFDSHDRDLLNAWKTKKAKNWVIKYSGNQQYALVFTSKNGFDELFFEKIPQISSNFFSNIEYIQERRLSLFLQQEMDISIRDLRKFPGMDEFRIELLRDNINGLARLVCVGITLAQLGIVSEDRLSNCLQKMRDGSPALCRFSIQQLLGLTRQPPSPESYFLGLFNTKAEIDDELFDEFQACRVM